MDPSAFEISSIDDVIELFERQWTADCYGLIESLVHRQPVEVRQELLLELLRVDIGRRYAIGLEVDLQQCFERFPEVWHSPESTAALCFEDFRSRQHRGRSLAADRWSCYPAVLQQSWFVQLQTQSSELESSSVFQSEGAGQASDTGSGLTEFTALPTAPDGNTDADVLGDFQLVALLGQGAFSKVFLARQISLGRRYVAVKVVNQPLREASHLARLQHTGIVPLYSCHRIQNKWLLCMPYCGSATLADWLKGEVSPGSRTGQSLVATIHNAQNRMTATQYSTDPWAISSAPNQEAETSLQTWHQAATQPLHQLSSLSASEFFLWIARRLASALAHAHQRGIVHGDLKPANILIRNDGEPALIDFNLSQITDAAPRSWRGGTLPYMAAEQLMAMISGAAGPACEQSDIFALGVILYELAEGRLPYDIPTSTAETDLLVAVQQRASTPKFRERQTCSEGCRTILRKCLAADPANRYSNAVLLLEDLDCEASHLPLKHAAEPFVSSRIPKLTRRFPRLFSAGSITVVALLLIAILLNALSGFRQRSERLASVEDLKTFNQQTDLRFAKFLQADPSASESSTPESVAADLASLKQLLKSHSNSVEQLSPDEQTQATQRLLALAFMEAHQALRSPRAASSRKDSVMSILEGLPEAARATRTGQIVQAIASSLPVASRSELKAARESALVSQTEINRNAQAKSISRTAAVDAADSVAESDVNPQLLAADETLLALALLLQSEPRRALELLDFAEPPESLRLIHWMTQGRALLEIGEVRRAVAAFTMALRDSDASDIRLNRGLAYLRLGSLPEADEDFSICIRQAPQNVAGYVNRYTVRNAMGRRSEALRDLDHAIQLQPESARLRLIRSRELRQAGSLKAAREDLEIAMKSRPASVNDWLSLAIARLPTDPQQALLDLESAATLHGPDTAILQTMAHVLSEHLDRPEDAIVALDQLLELEPAFQKALAGRSVLHARLGHVQQALADVARLESLQTPATPETLYQMACSLALCCRTQPELQLQSLTLLAQAVRHNYGGDLMAQDADLDTIRGLPEFDVIQKNHQLISRRRTP